MPDRPVMVERILSAAGLPVAVGVLLLGQPLQALVDAVPVLLGKLVRPGGGRQGQRQGREDACDDR